MLRIFEKESGVSGTEGAAEGPDPPVACVRGAGAGILSGPDREHFPGGKGESDSSDRLCSGGFVPYYPV